MKTPPQRYPEKRNPAGRPQNGARFPADKPSVARDRRDAPDTARRRYPSLSDDNQPPLFPVRLVALVAIVAIILVLAYRT